MEFADRSPDPEAIRSRIEWIGPVFGLGSVKNGRSASKTSASSRWGARREVRRTMDILVRPVFLRLAKGQRQSLQSGEVPGTATDRTPLAGRSPVRFSPTEFYVARPGIRFQPSHVPALGASGIESLTFVHSDGSPSSYHHRRLQSTAWLERSTSKTGTLGSYRPSTMS